MPGILIRWFLIALAVLIVPKVVSGVTVDDTGSALLAAAILGILNAFVRPVLILLTLPLTIVSLGFFILIINAFLFWLVASLDFGVHVSGFWPSFFAAIIISIASWVASNVVAGGGGEKTVILTRWGKSVDLRRGRGGRWE
ncbi:MAG: phage holin family protein [Desulfomonile sp.]|jgi:putative membrane protein|nr:phage holin family protein [Deltaproteobacteria bacterium]